MTRASRRHGSSRLSLLYLLPRLVTGGAETQAIRLAAALQARGHRVWIGVLAGGGDLEPEAERRGVRVVHFPRAWRYDPVPLTEIAAFCRAQRVDLLHAWLFLDGLYARLAARLAGRGLKVIVSAVGIEYGARSLRAGLDRALARWAERVAANSQWMARRLERLRFPPGRTVILPNMLDLDWLDAPVEPLPRPPGGAPIAGTVARLHAVKDIATFLNACARLSRRRPDLHVVVAGDGPEFRTLSRLAERLGLAPRLAMPGNVTDVRRILGVLDVFVLPSRSESCPNALLEAMGSGVPCVATRVGGIPEIIRDGDNGFLVPPGDADALAEKVGRLLDDATSRRRIGAAGAASVRKRFAADRVLPRYEDLYRHLAGR